MIPKTTGLPIRFADPPHKPDDVPGHVWIKVDHDYGSCDFKWRWALYEVAEEAK